ncbi:MAG TPA: sodium:solute symporter [Chitinophagaceae bacterium]|nr:sodium:solute symporter [Chitinophagaceae bacterium]
MRPAFLLCFVLSYFLLLLLIAWLTSRKGDNDTFFVANRNSRWWLVAFGMIGTSISGVTFISVPGTVRVDHFSYFQFILGNSVGYILIALVLLPLYYRMRLTSIYTYLRTRLGPSSYKTGAFFFLLSRTIGSSFRLFLVAIVLQRFIFDAWNIPFWLTVSVSLLLIWTYTFRGGLKTIIWTDSVQTVFLLASVILSVYFIGKSLNSSLPAMARMVAHSSYSRIFIWDHFMADPRQFVKHFLGGVAVSVAMTGLDQDLMQKNLSCRNVREARKNMFSFTVIFVLVNLFFLSVGALLYIFASDKGIPVPGRSDYLFPTIALQHLGTMEAVIFILGLTAATFATTDSALTALTTSFCVDFLGFRENQDHDLQDRSVRTRHLVHIGFSALFLIVTVGFRYLVSEAVVTAIFKVASYTYGPLLGLFLFGILSRRAVRDRWVPWVCVLSPLICFLLERYAREWFGYQFGFELLIVNGLITFAGLAILSRPAKPLILNS